MPSSVTLLEIGISFIILLGLGIGGYYLYQWYVNKPPVNPCQNGGILVGGVCQCPTGWSGTDCTNKTTSGCGGKICLNGGTCFNNTCQCPKGWYGQTCERSTCTPQTCYIGPQETGPSCILDSCSCTPGWASSGKEPYMCDICADGYWPQPGQGPNGTLPCSKKAFTDPINVALSCWIGWNAPEADTACKQYYGNTAFYQEINGSSNQCDCSSSLDSRPVCTIPQYYAPTAFNPTEWNKYTCWNSYQTYPTAGIVPF